MTPNIRPGVAVGIMVVFFGAVMVLGMMGAFRPDDPIVALTDPPHNQTVLAIGGTNMLKITGSDATNLVLWSRTQPVVTRTHQGWTVRFGK